jgi:periplasmic protein TonB
MKKILLFFAFVATVGIVHAQQPATPPPPPLPANHADPDATITITRPDTSKANKGKIFTSVEQVPEFPGGFNNFTQFLAKNIHYPADAVKNHRQGRVILSFVVETDGSLTEPKVVKGVSEDIDAEAIRVLKSSPKWQPGLQNGKPVRVQFAVPITFSL